MSYGIRYKVDVVYIPDGLGAMQVPNSQVLRFEPSSANPTGLTLGSGDAAQAAAPVPGGNVPTAANFTTAFNNMVTDLNAQVAAALARIQGFATGSG